MVSYSIVNFVVLFTTRLSKELSLDEDQNSTRYHSLLYQTQNQICNRRTNNCKLLALKLSDEMINTYYI